MACDDFIGRNEAWNYIVEDHVNNQNRDVEENKRFWNDLLCDPAFFGYSRICKEVLSGRKINVGGQELSIPYFVVSDSVSKKDLFVLDVQRYDSVPETQDINQLKFCIRSLGVNYSVLICDKIYIYHRTGSRSEVSFIPNNMDGKRFITEFNYTNRRPNPGSNHGGGPGPNPRPNPRPNPGPNSDPGPASSPVPRPDPRPRPRPDGIKISKDEALAIFIRKGYPLKNKTTTFSSLNSSLDIFWANPNIELLHKDWAIIFNDTSTHRLYLAIIPAYTFSLNMFKVRPDRPKYIDLQIKFENGRFEDTKSGVSFGEYIKEITDYQDGFVASMHKMLGE